MILPETGRGLAYLPCVVVFSAVIPKQQITACRALSPHGRRDAVRAAS